MRLPGGRRRPRGARRGGELRARRRRHRRLEQRRGRRRRAERHGRRLRRLALFQMALQASTRHVLVLDPDVRPGARLLQTLAHAAELPAARGMLGIAGWRALDDATTEATPATSSAATTTTAAARTSRCLTRRSASTCPGCSRSTRCAARGSSAPTTSTFLASRPTLPPDRRPAAAADGAAAAAGSAADAADEAEVSARLRRHVGLPSLVVPVAAHDRSTWGDLRGGSCRQPPRSCAHGAACSGAARRRGDAPPPWRAAAAAAARRRRRRRAARRRARGGGQPAARAAGASEGAAAGRPPHLEKPRDARDAAALRPLTSHFASAASLYEPRMVDLRRRRRAGARR